VQTGSVVRSVKYRVTEIANGGQAASAAFHSSVIVSLHPPSLPVLSSSEKHASARKSSAWSWARQNRPDCGR